MLPILNLILNMWDVVWTDPERKSRKEHRDRKREKSSKQPRSDTAFGTARSISSRSSTSTSTTSFNGNFLTVSPGCKRAARNFASPSPTLSSFPASPTSLTSTALETENDTVSIFSACSESTPTISTYVPSIHEHSKIPNHSIHCSRSIISVSKQGNLPQPASCLFILKASLVDVQVSSSEVFDDTHLVPPISPTWPCPPVERVALEPHHLVQTLSEDSFITRSTEVTLTTRSSCDMSMATSSEVTITADTDKKGSNRPLTPNSQ